jgi:predicted  nucleic acid-binding Zn-ribbon protein
MLEIVTEAIDKLTELKEQIADLGSIKTEHNKAKHDLKAAKAELVTAQADLKSATSGLTLVQVKNLKEFEENIFNKRKELEALIASTATAQAYLADLTAEVRAAEARHSAIEASIDSLRKKIG